MLERRQVNLEDMEFGNIAEFYERFPITEGYIIGIDPGPCDMRIPGVDLVAYDLTDMHEHGEYPANYEEFTEIVTENALDESEFEVDRVTLFKGSF